MRIHIAATECLSHLNPPNPLNEKCYPQFSLDALGDITHPAHAFASTEDINDVTLIKLQYNCGEELVTHESNHVLPTLIKNNRQRRTRYKHIINGVFAMRRKHDPIPMTVDIQAGGEVIVDDHHDDDGLSHQETDIAKLKHVVCAWIVQQAFMVMLPIAWLMDKAIEKKIS